MTPQELKNSILQLAIQGKLVEQRAEEGTAAELLRDILTQRRRDAEVGRSPRDRRVSARNGGRGATALPGACKADDAAGVNGGRGATALPVRKRLNHRGPLSIDVSSAWYFITICAEGHNPWVIDPSKSAFAGRAVAPRPPLEIVAPLLLREARENQLRALWRLALFLVMPDHLHLIVHVPNGGRGATALPGACKADDAAGVNGGRGATALPRVIENFKHLLSSRYGLRFQRDFFDTRLRDDAHFAEKYNYILGNPVRKNLCAEPSEWPHSIAFSRETGTLQ